MARAASPTASLSDGQAFVALVVLVIVIAGMFFGGMALARAGTTPAPTSVSTYSPGMYGTDYASCLATGAKVAICRAMWQ